MSRRMTSLLLVEDQPADAEIFADALDDPDGRWATLVHVLGVEEAIRHVSEHRVDCVMLDLGLPGYSGQEALTELLLARRSIPVIVLTGNAAESAAVEAVATGAQDYIVKRELTPGGLRRAVAYAIERHRIRSEMAAMFTNSPTPAARIRCGEQGCYTVVEMNGAMGSLLGPDVVRSANLRDWVHGDDQGELQSVLTRARADAGLAAPGTLPQREIRMNGVGGEILWVLLSAAAIGAMDQGGYQEMVLQLTDITERREAEQALVVLATTDAVTGLPNRSALEDRLSSALARLRRTPGLVCVLFCDLDHFKAVNDSLGHKAGDVLLAEVGRRLRAAVRPEDTVARLGGDEFVVLFEGLPDAAAAVLKGLSLRARLGTPWEYEGHVFTPAMSVGVVTTIDPDASIVDLLRRADLAMYRAKDAGRDRVEMYDRTLEDTLAQTVTARQQLRAALDERGLVLDYQPLVDLTDETVVGVEALLRMRSADGTLIPPAEFLPFAESSGLIVPVGKWVLQRAFADLRRWRHLGHPFIMSVNVSPTQLSGEGFSDLLLSRAAQADVDPSWLCVEITETALLRGTSDVPLALGALHSAGVSIALDDFGTGFSSLAWLTELPVDSVKIDKSFTSRLGTDPRHTAIVRAIIQIAGSLDLTVIAEGVETAEQRDRLVHLGCAEGQGFYFGRPVPADDPSWG